MAEFWQGSPMGPPVQISFKPGTTRWQLGILNNARLNSGAGPQWYDGATLSKDSWHTIAFRSVKSFP
ncbi:hypothetical protein [Streptomyces albospinus]|nr:hypothetical protein [Streptomyces albospinus]